MLNRDTKRKFDELKRCVNEKRKKNPPAKTAEDVKSENLDAKQLMPYIYNQIGEVS